ncbi:MAG TPA: SDR family oxidoreductase [Pyrinomonadaceae bacterium]|nr:SDR family oxidoreductase [Pyrinomonadaceae bacterium]
MNDIASNETYFITGFPGFIATRLVRRLAESGSRFLLLAQPALLEQAKREVATIVPQTNASAGGFEILAGDITARNLGLSQSDLARARAETTHVFHLAAIYDLAVTQETAMRVNVEGTRNVNTFAQGLSGLRHYHYVSTCYVAGKRKGNILETELRHDAGFRNHYEETKYLAEIEVEELKRNLPITIHRPSVVCGDSSTGETVKYDGIYYLIRYLLKWPSVLSNFNIGNDEVSLNLVPVDFVVEAMAKLASDRNAIGATVQLADPRPLSTRNLFNLIAKCLVGREALVTVPPRLVESSLMLPPTPAISGLPHYGVPYFFLKQQYDTSEASRLLAPHHVTCPPFASYVKTLVDYVVSHPTL